MDYSVLLNNTKSSLASDKELNTAIEIGNYLITSRGKTHAEAYIIENCPYKYNGEDTIILFQSYITYNKDKKIIYLKIICNNNQGLIELTDDLQFKLLVEPTWLSIDIFSKDCYICYSLTEEPVLVNKSKDSEEFLAYSFDEHAKYTIPRNKDSWYEINLFLHGETPVIGAFSVGVNSGALKINTEVLTIEELLRRCIILRNSYMLLESKSEEYKDSVELLDSLVEISTTEGKKYEI